MWVFVLCVLKSVIQATMVLTPYTDACGSTTLSTLGEQPIGFSYLLGTENTNYYPTANVTATLGPIQTPQIYAKDLNILEIGSSGQVMMSLQDQSSISFSNDVTNTITYLQGANNNAIYLLPTDSNSTTHAGHLTTDSSGQWQELSTKEMNGISWNQPVKISSTLDVFDSTALKDTLDVCGATVLWSTLSVHDSVTFSQSFSTRDNARFQSTLNTTGPLTVSGSTTLSSGLSVTANTTFQKTMDVCGNVAMWSTLSVGQSMRVTGMYATSINVESITSTGAISFANDAIMMQGMEVFGEVRLASTLSVHSDTTFAKTVDVCGSTELWSNLSVQGITHLESSLFVAGTASLMSNLTVASTLSVNGATTLQSTMDVCGSTLFRNSLSVADILTIKDTAMMRSTLSVLNDVHLASSMDVLGLVRTSNDMIVQGSLSVYDSVQMDASVNVLGEGIWGQKEFYSDKSLVLNNIGYATVSGFSFYNTSFTISAWVKRTTTAAIKILEQKKAYTSLQTLYMHILYTTGDLVVGFWNSDLGADNQIAVGSWYFVTFAVDLANNSLKSLYVNGSLKASGANGVLNTFGVNTIDFFRTQGSNATGGFIEDLSIHSKALTGPEVQALFNGGVPIDLRTHASTSSTLQMYYRFNDSLLDSSTYGRHMTWQAGTGIESYSIDTPNPSTFTPNRNVYISNEVSVGTIVQLDASANMRKSVTTDSNLWVDGTSMFRGMMIESTLDICGAVVMRSTATLSVSDTVTFDSTLKVLSGTGLMSTLDVSGAWTVQQAVKMGSTLSVTDIAKIHSTLDVSGSTRLWSTLSVQDTARFSSTLMVSGHTELGSNLTVNGTLMEIDGAAVLGSALSVFSATSLQSTMDVCGSTVFRNNLLVNDSVDVCGNTHVYGTLSVSNSTMIGGDVVAKNTLSVLQSATFSTDMKSDLFRPYNNDATTRMTIDASKVIIQGNVDIIGTLNTFNNIDEIRVQDKRLTFSVDPSGGQHKDGTFTNHASGIYVDGLPNGVTSDPYRLKEKSFAWEYDTVNGASWYHLGANSSDNSVKPIEPAWQMRGGSFKIANYRDASNGALFTMRINAVQEFEVWRSLLVNDAWQHHRITRFGLNKTVVTPASLIYGFTASLGETLIGTTSMSLRIVSVDDTLYTSRKVLPTYTISNIYLLSGSNAYSVPNGFSFGTLHANNMGVITVVSDQIVTGLPEDTSFNAVSARITNQYGVYADLVSFMSPLKHTLDLSGPQIVNTIQCSVAPNVLSIGVTMSTFDIGVSTTTYNGVVFASKYTNLNLSDVSILTPNTYTYTGTGKTSQTADTRTFTLSTDGSGTVMNNGIYYVYYVLYDTNGNRSTNQGAPLGPYTLLTSTISAFTAVLGESTIGASTLSLRIASVSDTLFANSGILPTYTISNVYLAYSTSLYQVQNGFSLGTLYADSAGTITNSTNQVVSSLPVDTSFNAVRATITNQYGVSATLTTAISPTKYTLDTSGPQILNSVSVTVNSLTLDVSMSTYDIGLSTSNYQVVVLTTLSSSYNLSSITASTQYAYAYTGTGKTSSAPYIKSFNFSTDISGIALTSGSYYLYYVMYDPNGNRTTNQGSPLGPYTIVANVSPTNFQTFTSSGTSIQTWIPNQSGTVKVSLGGGTNGNANTHGYITTNISVTAGRTYTIAVATNGGGLGPGGASAFGDRLLNRWMVVAGGGGGNNGGKGGISGVDLGKGVGCGTNGSGGTGGTLTVGGVVTAPQSGSGAFAGPGSQYYGGSGGGQNNTNAGGYFPWLNDTVRTMGQGGIGTGSGAAGGGGAGWWGGAGGGKSGGSGGGGSSHYDATNFGSVVTLLPSVNPGACTVVISSAT